MMLTPCTQVRVATSSFCCIILTNMVTALAVEQQISLLEIPRLLLLDAHVDVRASAQTVTHCYTPRCLCSSAICRALTSCFRALFRICSA